MKAGKWIFSKQADIWIMLFPVWVCWIVAFSLSDRQLQLDVPIWVFVIVVIGIDVSHVWSTIFRTYLDPEEFRLHRRILIAAPIISFVVAFGLAAISIDLFWRCLAYVAVYHFVKQQYGFMRIYKAKNRDFHGKLIGDNFVIYLSMLYPIIFWHLSADREFAWFVEEDFVSANIATDLMGHIVPIANSLYFLILGWWLWDEIKLGRIHGNLQLGKILWVLTTAFNWFLGIIYFNSDIVFTITNVVAHGLPYIALIIFYQEGKERMKGRLVSGNWTRISLSVISLVLILAFTEEYLWDALVYRDYENVFFQVLGYPFDTPAFFVQWLAIGMLTVPQLTHYILDGYIWKNNDKNPYLKQILLK